MTRTILAAIKPCRGQDPLISEIVSLAKRHDLMIDAISIIDPAQLAPSESVPRGAEKFKIECDQKNLAAGRQTAASLMGQLAGTAARQKVECVTQVADGTVRELLASAVQRADLLVCGVNRQANSAERSLLFSILKYAVRPVLLIPPDHGAGEDVLLAYDGSRQAARALSSFVFSGLWKDRIVHLIAIDNGLSQLAESIRSAAIYLQRHGIHFELHVRQHSRDIGQDLIEEIDHLPIGMVVMGAFGKNAVHQFLLGSVTRTLLGALPVPLFLDH